MSRPWRLTRQAEASLVDIARWTLETFGPRQAAAYEEDLIRRCADIAEGTAISQECRQLIDSALPEDLRFARSGQHFVVFVDRRDRVIIVDFLHSRSDLPRKLAALREGASRCRPDSRGHAR
jgi:toxin ParE1/3/4